RIDGLALGPAVLVCNEEHRFIAAEQARVWGGAVEAILLEPVARNTAPAVALAALHAQAATGADPLLLVLAADHVIADVAAFHAAVAAAAHQAERGRLVTFGIAPVAAGTGYGYIRRGALLSREESVYEVAAFVEKPDADTARAYLETGDYYWNSGIFVFRASRFL